MSGFLSRLSKNCFRKARKGEIIAFLAVITLCIISQWRLWVGRELMFTHDSLRWYGIFSYWADALSKGGLSFWNPYMNCGEPFFVNLNILRLCDPSTFILIFIGKALNFSYFSLYHYDLLIRYLIFISGCYLFFRHIAKYKVSVFIAFISITFSSLAASYFRQHGFILNIYLLPWIALSAFKLLEGRRPVYLLALALFLGILIPSYTALYTFSFIVILLTALLFTKGLPRPGFSVFLEQKRVVLLAAAIIALLSLRVIPLLLIYKNLFPAIRVIDVTHAAYSQPLDFLNLMAPYYFEWYFFISNLTMSESFLYIGLTPLLFLMAGVFFSPHRYKLGFLVTAGFIALLMLGDKTFIHYFMKRFFPAFSFIRNMHFFGPFFIFCLSYFVCIGADVIFAKIYRLKEKLTGKLFNICFFVFVALIIGGCLFAIAYFLQAANNFQGIRDPAGTALLSGDAKNNSLINLSLFIVSAIVIFFLILKARTRLVNTVGVSLVLLCILGDLLIFNRVFSRYMLQPVPSENFVLTLPPSETIYRNFRIPKAGVILPFGAAIFKVPVAYPNPDIHGTHFLELSDYYKFRTLDISDDVKDIWAGVTKPRLRLVPQGVVLPEGYGENIITFIQPEIAKQAVFIQEHFPQEYRHLETTLENIDFADKEMGQIEVLSFKPDRINLEVSARDDCLLYYSDGYEQSWRVFIDGKEDKIYQANLAFKAVIVPEGLHRVSFIYDPRFYKFSLWCYLAGLLILAVVFIRIVVRYFKRRLRRCSRVKK